MERLHGYLRFAGGIIGGNFSTSMSNCYNYGMITCFEDCGGIFSYGSILNGKKNGVISNCYNEGTVNSTKNTGAAGCSLYDSTNKVTTLYTENTGAGRAGGIGTGSYHFYYSDCINSGEIKSGGVAGGIVASTICGGKGANSSNIKKCINTGNIKGNSFSRWYCRTWRVLLF